MESKLIIIINILMSVALVLISINVGVSLYKHFTKTEGFCMPNLEIEKYLEVTPEIKAENAKVKELIEQTYPELRTKKYSTNINYSTNESYISVFK